MEIKDYIDIAAIRQELIESYKKEAAITQKIETLEQNKKELEETRKNFAAYDLFMQCMHPSGISYDIIKNKLPIINAEIAKILLNIVNFTITLINDDSKLDIMIKHPKFDPRPLEMGSGAEKTLASMAIRLALLKITSLPKCNSTIMDEPGTSLDKENLEGFLKILEYMKTTNDWIILISHLDSFKDTADSQLLIEKKNSYAHICN